MAQPPRTPPRFVPTLTEVVQGAAVPPASPVPAHGAGVPASPARPPASAAPVSLAPAPVAAFAVPPKAPATPVAPAAPVALQLPEGFEEHLVHRVMQRVDVELDLRLREAIATVVQEQTRSMVPRLREEVESVVRHAVYEAVAQELEAPR
ncbi:hypothetical protein YS110_02735 [Acidovorax sp. YS12]|nr:hypothetical protein YS110_02735 [Acidovorax sp. YS12]